MVVLEVMTPVCEMSRRSEKSKAIPARSGNRRLYKELPIGQDSGLLRSSFRFIFNNMKEQRVTTALLFWEEISYKWLFF